MLNEYVSELDYKLLSLIVTEIGNLPMCSGSFKGAIIKFGKEAVTKEDDYPRSILTNEGLSLLSGSIIFGNLNALVLPISIVMSLKIGENSGGPELGTIAIAITGGGGVDGGGGVAAFFVILTVN
jgi:hypothetical protein